MRKLYCFTLGFFLLTVRAEKHFQGHHTEQTKGTTVIKDLLLKKEKTIGHGTEATTTENTHRHTAVAVAAKFPGVVLFDARPTPPYERIQITEASAIIASPSGARFVSRNGQNSLTPTRDNPSAMRIHTESEVPLISNYEKNVFSSTQAAFESMLNGTSEPEVHLSTDAVKPFLWLHTLLDNRIRRNTDSVALTSADAGPGVPILSASRPRVIDNLAALRNDNDDKRSKGKDEKGISNLGRNEYPLGTMQSIFQNDTADDSVSGNAVTNLCLTCLKDRRASTEKSVALPALSPDASSDSLRTEGLASDPNQFKASLPSLHQQSAGEQEEILNKEIIHQNIKYSVFSVEEQPLLSFNKTVNHSQSILNNSQIKSFFPDTGTVASVTRSLAEMSSDTQIDNKKQSKHTYPTETFVTERLSSTTAVLYRSSKSLYTGRKPVKNGEQKVSGKKVSIGHSQSKLMYFSMNNTNASHSLSTNFKNVFLQKQPLDFSSGPVSNTPVSAEAPQSGERGVFPEGSVHSSHSLSGPTISVLKSQTPANPSSKTKEPVSTFLPTDSAIKSASVTTMTHLTDEQDSQTFNAGNSILKQSVVDASAAASKKAQTLTFTTRKAVVHVKSFPSESRRDSDDDTTMLTRTTLSNKSSSERPSLSRLLENTSKIPQERTFDVSSDYRVAPTHQSFAKYNRESLIAHSLKLGDKNEQVLTVVAEDGDKEIKTEGKQIKEIIKLQEEEGSRDTEELERKREELFRSDKTESRKQEEIINKGVKINQNTDREGEKMEEHHANVTREEGGGTLGEEDVTLGQNKDPRQGEIRDKESGGRKGEPKINTENSTNDLGEEQRESLTNKGAGARKEETARKEDIKHKTDMTNVPLGPTTNSKELNRDKGHTVTDLSCCRSLIKQSGATEPEGIHLGENITQSVEMKNKPFSYKVTINHTPLHSTLRSQSPKLSRMTSLPKKSYTQIKTHRSTRHGEMPSPAKGRTQSEVADATFSVTAKPKMLPKLTHSFGVSTSKFSDTLKPTTSPPSSGTKSAHPVLNNVTNMMSLATPRLAITAGSLRAQLHFTEHSFTPSVSVHRHKIGTSALKANSLLQATNENEHVQHIMSTHIFESNVKDPLTSNIIEEVHTSTPVNPAPPQQMYNDSSTRLPAAAALSSEANISTGQLQPHQGQSPPQISQSSSSDLTSGQPCSFKPSEQTAHSDASHAPVDDNKQRSVQTLMASMSPEAKNDQFPLSSMSPLLNLMLFGGDSLPGTYSLTGLTRSVSEKEISRADSDAEYANSASGHAMSLLGTADETDQTEEYDSAQTIVTSVKHSDAVTKQTAGNTDEKKNSPFTAQTVVRSKHHANNTDGFNSMSVTQTEKLAVKNTTENKDDDLFNVDGNDEANNTVKTTLESNHLSQIEGYNATSTTPTVFTMQTTHRTEKEVSEDFVPVMNDFAEPVLDTTDRTGTTAFVKSDSLPEMPKIQRNDATNNAISEMPPHAVKTTEKQHDPSTPQDIVGDNAIPVPHNFRSDLKVPRISTQPISDQIMNVTSEFQMPTSETDDFVSLAPTASKSGPVVSTEAHESVLNTSESMQFVTEKSFQVAHSELKVQSNSHIEPLSLREAPATPTTGKLTPAVRGKNTTETQSVEQPEHEISVQAIEQSQHAPPDMIAVAPFTQSVQGAQAGLLEATHRVGRAHDRTRTTAKRVGYSSFKDIKTALTTKSAFEAKYSLHERTLVVHTLHREGQYKKHSLPEKTSISQGIVGAVTDSVPSTGISPTEIINKTSCGTIGCAKPGETTKTTIGPDEIDHTAAEKMYKTPAGNIRRDYFNAAHTPATKTENGNCSTDCPVPGKATPQATDLDYVVLSPAASKSDHDRTPTDETMRKHAKSMTDETRGALVESGHLRRSATPEQAQSAEKTAQRHSQKETSEAQGAIATKVILSVPEATTAETTIKSTERTLLTEKNSKTQLNRGAAKAETFEAQNATRSTRTVAKGETSVQESGRRLSLPETESESELPSLKHRRGSSPHLYLSGVTEVSDDLCGSGNYTAEMSLNLGRGVEPGDAVPALGNLRVVINLKTNNSQINLEVTSCCLSPTIQPDLTNSTCCLFSRLAAEPAGITLLPSALSTSASFTISLFQMINYSVVYLHCDLSVCLRNRSDCERQCLQQRSAFPLEAIVTNLRNRISFGPMLKEVKNSTFPEEIDPSELDLVLVIISLVAGSSLVTVTLLLVWLAYRRRAIWLLRSAASPRPCCGCLCQRGDLILP